MSTKILIIGAGGIGARHFESIISNVPNLQIEIRDFQEKLSNILDTYKNQITEYGENRIKLISTTSPFGDDHYDFGIIATGASVQTKTFSEVLSQARIGRIILEKPLANSLQGINGISKLITQVQDVRVNLPRGNMTFYKRIKQAYFNQNMQGVVYRSTVRGSNWGLLSNCLHFVGLVNYLGGIRLNQISNIEIDDIFETKRLGFFDIHGRISIQDDYGNQLELIDTKSEEEMEISIKTEHDEINIYEQKGFARNAKNLIVNGSIEFQSDMTHKYFNYSNNQIIAELPSASEFIRLNNSLISVLEKSHFPSENGNLKFT